VTDPGVPGGEEEDRIAWEHEAERWVRWARTPGHDAYWYYRDSFFDRLVPPPGRLTLEVGCGEGRVSRDLAARGHRVVAFDGSPSLIGHARRADPSGRHVLGLASALPFGEASVDLVVAYNCLMDVDDLSGAVIEMARVLEPGATVCICITHPILDAGGFDGDATDAPYRLRETYFGTRRFDETVTRRGLTMRFRGWSRALEDYFAALSTSGLVVDTVREPVPAAGADDYEHWHRYPMFLHLRAIKR
jgi:SAM-dependent methyltransferase